MIVSSISMDLKLPGEKIRKIRREAHCLLNQTQPTAQLLSQLLGKLNATSPALQKAFFFFLLTPESAELPNCLPRPWKTFSGGSSTCPLEMEEA